MNAQFKDLTGGDAQAAARLTLARTHGVYRRANLPMSIDLDLTYRCDLDCDHCYLENKQTWPEMTTQEWRSLLEQMKELGTLQLGWSGGEVFARKDFPELIGYAGALGFLSVVKTHGGNVTPERARHLANSGVYRVDVSVYSLDDAIHDGITLVPGSLQATFRGMRILREAGLGVRATVVVMRSNFREIDAIDAYIRAMDCYPNFTVVIVPDHTGDTSLDRLALTPMEMIEARLKLASLRKERGDPMIFTDAEDDGVPCAAGRSHIYITPDGAVWPCLNFPMSLGHLREESLNEIWYGSAQRQELKEYTNADRPGCSSCAGNGLCGYCQGQAYTRTGDWRTPPPQFHIQTRIAMETYQTLGAARFTAAQWRSVPLPEIPDSPVAVAPQDKKFVFPIYRPTKGRNQRAHKVVANLGRSSGGCSS